MTKTALESFQAGQDTPKAGQNGLQGGSGRLQGGSGTGNQAETLSAAFARGAIGVGDVIHCRTSTLFGRMIRRSVGSWGCHDALIAWHAGKPVVCDAAPIRARFTPFAEYEAAIAAGKKAVVVLQPTVRRFGVDMPAGRGSGFIAAAWWDQNVRGRFYDFGAFPRLFAKSIVGDRCSWPAGWEWAWYCTESCRDAWLAAGFDLWGKTNPTPRTTEKRTLSGQFRVVWHSMPANPFAIPAHAAANAAEGKDETK